MLGILKSADKQPNGFIAFYDNSDYSLKEKFTFYQLRGFGVAIVEKPYGVDIMTNHATYEVPYDSNIPRMMTYSKTVAESPNALMK